jgi:hypothetical protein
MWFSLGIPVSSTNKTDHHDITEMLLKVALNIIKLKPILPAFFLLPPFLSSSRVFFQYNVVVPVTQH